MERIYVQNGAMTDSTLQLGQFLLCLLVERICLVVDAMDSLHWRLRTGGLERMGLSIPIGPGNRASLGLLAHQIRQSCHVISRRFYERR